MPEPSCSWPHLSAMRATLALCVADLTRIGTLRVRLAHRAGGDRRHRAKHSKESRSFNLRCGSKSLGDALRRSTEIAHTTAGSAVQVIAKVTDQRQHAALIAFRKANHLIDLRPLLLPLGHIGRSP